jgi:hypothetical protein
VAFIAGILPLLHAFGVGGAALSTAATVIPAALGALDVASGIVQKDPAKIAGGVLSGTLGGLGGTGALGGTSAADGTKALASTPISSASVAGMPSHETIMGALNAPLNKAQEVLIPDISTAGSPAFVPSATSMPWTSYLGAGLQGANSLASGVLGIMAALKKPHQNSGDRLKFGNISTGLAPYGEDRASALPNLPTLNVPGAGQVPTYSLPDLSKNEMMLKLLQAYQG